MKNRKLLLIVSLVLALTMSLGGTLAYLTDTDADVNVMTLGKVSIAQNEQRRVEANGEFTSELEPFQNDKMLLPYTDRKGTADKITVGEYEIELGDTYNNYIDKIVSVTNTGNTPAYVRTLVAVPTGNSDHWHEYDASADMWLHWNMCKDVYTHYDLEELTGPANYFITVNGVEYEVWQFTHKEALAAGKTTYPVIRGLFMDKRVDMNEDGYFLTDNAGNVWPINNIVDKNGKVNVLVVSQAVQASGFTDVNNNGTAADDALAEAFSYGDKGANVQKWFTDLFNTDGTVNEDMIGTPGDKWPNNDVPVLDSWENEANKNWGDPIEEGSSEYVIKTATELAAFAKSVNEGKTYQGMTVKLAADIDLAGKTWTPIGNSTNKFQGTFDGQNHTISNLTVSMPGKSDVGLFGMTTNGEIKNLTVDNATVIGRLDVGVVAGTPYTSKYTNITVTGLIKVDGMAYVGGVGGKNAYANWTNITVNADEGSYVRADSVEDGKAYRTYVGGVIGFMGEGSHSFTNVESNIDVFGSTCDVGGITGIAHYGNSFVNCSSSGDVFIFNATEADESEEMGGIAGVWNNGRDTVTFTDCSFNGKLSANFTEGVNLSDNTITGKAYSTTGAGKLFINGTEIK